MSDESESNQIILFKKSGKITYAAHRYWAIMDIATEQYFHRVCFIIIVDSKASTKLRAIKLGRRTDVVEPW